MSFFVSGTIGGMGAAARTVSAFGGDAVVSGSLSVGGGFGSTGVTLSSAGNVSADGNAIVLGTLDLGNASDTTIARSAAGTVTIEGVTVATETNTLTLTNKTINLSSNTLIATSAQLAAAVSDETGSGALVFAASPTLVSPTIQGTGGTTAMSFLGSNAAVAGSLTVGGDLTVQGTTVTADVTTVTVEDPLIALGFTSGSVAVTAGDRGFVGGISGGQNVSVFWDNSESEFAVARTTSNPDATAIVVASYGGLQAGNIKGSIVSASLGFSGSHTKLLDGTSAFVAGSGIAISSASNGAVTITSTATATPGGSDTHVQFNDGGSFGGS
ncbi:MAG: hypothetical protein FJ167_12340, partial [Gammaproteobacteria bacterium]|nr:hypothetical protein [Gammaproteobacteria bacterium]